MNDSTYKFNSAQKEETNREIKGWINCKKGSAPQTVLVEDDPQVRGVWLTVAIRMQLSFALYSNPEDFLKDLPRLSDGTHFYLDQDFGFRRGLGIQLSKEIRKVHQKSNIFLITAYPRDLFHREIHLGIIDEVYSKYPWPFTINNARSS